MCPARKFRWADGGARPPVRPRPASPDGENRGKGGGGAPRQSRRSARAPVRWRRVGPGLSAPARWARRPSRARRAEARRAGATRSARSGGSGTTGTCRGPCSRGEWPAPGAPGASRPPECRRRGPRPPLQLGPVAGQGRVDAPDVFVEGVRRLEGFPRPGRAQQGGILRVGHARRAARGLAETASGSPVKGSAEGVVEAVTLARLRLQVRGILVLVGGAVTCHQAKHMVPEQVQEGSAKGSQQKAHRSRAAEDFLQESAGNRPTGSAPERIPGPGWACRRRDSTPVRRGAPVARGEGACAGTPRGGLRLRSGNSSGICSRART